MMGCKLKPRHETLYRRRKLPPIVVSGKRANGEFAVVEMTVLSAAGANPHSHENIVEIFYILEGEITFQTEVRSYLAKKGALVKIPKGGLLRGFKNRTDKKAKLLCTVMPAGLDDYFIETVDYRDKNPNDTVKIKRCVW